MTIREKLHKFFDRLLVIVIGGLAIISITVTIVLKINWDNVRVKERVCQFYFGNVAQTLAFLGISDRYLSGKRWVTALAVIEVESGYYQYAYSTVPKVVREGGKKVIIRKVLCRGYFALDFYTFQIICKNYGIKYRGYSDIYDSANNILAGIIHLRDCLDTYGKNQGLEIYNVGAGNYFNKGWRNPDYVEKVLKSEQKVLAWEREFRRQLIKKTSIRSVK